MDPNRRRKLLFFSVCLPVRFLIAALGIVLVQYHDALYILSSAYCLVTAAVFGVHTGLWACSVERLGGFGGAIWWHRVRILHTILWATAGVVFAVRGPGGWLLLADAVLGLTVGVVHHTTGITF